MFMYYIFLLIEKTKSQVKPISSLGLQGLRSKLLHKLRLGSEQLPSCRFGGLLDGS